ncbi:MAG: type II secretion system protein [Oscillospiraceae bacterium]|nr:type II secretion system protein [Oscillospiraceae bacterium]
MKKILKGFTLVELIVVMAILVILMAAIMNMFKPIRETYVDATLYENQRTTQNGIIQYITESVRYATDIGLYTSGSGGASSVTDAVEKFTDKYLAANGVKTTDADYSTKRSNTLSLIKKNAEVIIIDNSTGIYSYNGQNYKGRLVRRKAVLNGSGEKTELTNSAENIATNEARLALGAAYYGNSNYTITLDMKPDPTGTKFVSDDGIKVTVASSATSGVRSNSVIKTSGTVICKNVMPISGNNGVIKAGVFDTDNYVAANATGADNTKIYIVFLNDKVKIS